MSDVRGRAVAAMAAAALLSAVLPAAGTTPPAPPPCETVHVSPDFAHDHTVVCVSRAGSTAPRILGVSRDGGRSWHAPAMAGLVRPDGSSGIPLAASLSPAYSTDHDLFVTTGSGTFVSTDLGENFAALDPLATGGGTDGNPVPYVTTAPALLPGLPTGPRVFLAYASTRVSATVDVAARTHQPVPGVPGYGVLRFTVPPVWDGDAASGLAFVYEAEVAQTTAERLVAYRCDARLTCSQRLFSFPADVSLDPSVDRVTLLPDRRTIVAVLSSQSTRSLHVWRSTDGGVTFTPWQSIEALLGPVSTRSGMEARVGLGAAPGDSHRLYLRIHGGRGRNGWGGPPAEQVFRSDDGGTTWRRVAYGLGPGQPGRRGTLPWSLMAGGGDGAQLSIAPDGRLFTVGGQGGGRLLFTTYCSLDGGLHWTAGCPR
jgi:hypothetical protein